MKPLDKLNLDCIVNVLLFEQCIKRFAAKFITMLYRQDSDFISLCEAAMKGDAEAINSLLNKKEIKNLSNMKRYEEYAKAYVALYIAALHEHLDGTGTLFLNYLLNLLTTDTDLKLDINDLLQLFGCAIDAAGPEFFHSKVNGLSSSEVIDTFKHLQEFVELGAPSDPVKYQLVYEQLLKLKEKSVPAVCENLNEDYPKDLGTIVEKCFLFIRENCDGCSLESQAATELTDNVECLNESIKFSTSNDTFDTSDSLLIRDQLFEIKEKLVQIIHKNCSFELEKAVGKSNKQVSEVEAGIEFISKNRELDRKKAIDQEREQLSKLEEDLECICKNYELEREKAIDKEKEQLLKIEEKFDIPVRFIDHKIIKEEYEHLYGLDKRGTFDIVVSTFRAKYCIFHQKEVDIVDNCISRNCSEIFAESNKLIPYYIDKLLNCLKDCGPVSSGIKSDEDKIVEFRKNSVIHKFTFELIFLLSSVLEEYINKHDKKIFGPDKIHPKSPAEKLLEHRTLASGIVVGLSGVLEEYINKRDKEIFGLDKVQSKQPIETLLKYMIDQSHLPSTVISGSEVPGTSSGLQR